MGTVTSPVPEPPRQADVSQLNPAAAWAGTYTAGDTAGGTLSLHPAGQDAAVQPLGPQPRHGRREGDKLKTTYCLETPTL